MCQTDKQYLDLVYPQGVLNVEAFKCWNSRSVPKAAQLHHGGAASQLKTLQAEVLSSGIESPGAQQLRASEQTLVAAGQMEIADGN